MKKYITIFIAANLVILVLVMGMVFLEANYPFQPGQGGYNLQHAVEQTRLYLAKRAGNQADYALELADRRLADLAMASNTQEIEDASATLYLALDQAVVVLTSGPGGTQDALQERFDQFLIQADYVIEAVANESDDPSIAALDRHLLDLLADTEGETIQLAQAKPAIPARIDAAAISFLGEEVEHNLLPLIGGHAELECESCHTDGVYKGTSDACSSCHLSAPPDGATIELAGTWPATLDLYPEHFTGECSDCHGVDDWSVTDFDHEGINDCLSCHAEDLPLVESSPDMPIASLQLVSTRPQTTYGVEEDEAHYPGECMLCHSDTIAWEEAAFDHAEVTECESCHERETPGGHYAGACTNCHADVKEWDIVAVDHAEYPDCLTCHIDDDPTNHYPGLCSSCHNDTSWTAAFFNHTGYTDCASCHSKPSKHFNGGCAGCHDEATWEVASYSHKGVTPACKNCHDEPKGHFGSGCATCHSTSNWRAVKLDHSGSTNCTTCHSAGGEHYLGSCANCHSTSVWASATFSHAGYSDCLSCHNPPSGHYTGLCSKCHSTQSWSSVDFDHSGLVDCLSCHSGPGEHYAGQCSACHAVTSWKVTEVDHSGLSDCSSCHSIDGHWPGQCSDCHTIQDWSDYTFLHSGYTNCKSCHTRPANHTWRGQCGNCHTTDTWVIGTATPTLVDGIELLYSRIIGTPVPPPPVSRDITREVSTTPVPPSSR